MSVLERRWKGSAQYLMPLLPSIPLYLHALDGRRCQIRHPVDPTCRGWICCRGSGLLLAVGCSFYWSSPWQRGRDAPLCFRLGHVHHVRLHLVRRWTHQTIHSSTTLGIRGQGVRTQIRRQILVATSTTHTMHIFTSDIFLSLITPCRKIVIFLFYICLLRNLTFYESYVLPLS